MKEIEIRFLHDYEGDEQVFVKSQVVNVNRFPYVGLDVDGLVAAGIVELVEEVEPVRKAKSGSSKAVK